MALGTTTRRVAAVMLIVTVSACSGNDEVSEQPPAEPTAPAPAERDDPRGGPSLSPRRVEPFDRIDLLDLAPDTDLLALEVWMVHEPHDALLPVLVDDGGPHVTMPFHPAEPMGGGIVDLVMVADGERMPLPSVEVGPLEPADGAWNDFVAALDAAVSERAIEQGAAPDELRELSFDDTPADLLPIKLAQTFIDDGTGNDLESIYDDEGLSDDDRALLDALVAEIDLVSLLPDAHRPTGFRSTQGPRSRPADVSRVAPSGRGHPRQTGGCVDAGVEVGDAEDLSNKMTTALDNTILEGGAEQQVLSDIGSATTAGGFIPGVGPMISAVGAGFLTLEVYLNATAGMYPSSLDSLEASISETWFAEDFLAPESWDSVKVVASSTGWTADADVLEAMLSWYSATGAAVVGAAGATVKQGFALDAAQYVRDNLATEFLRAVGGELSFCPETWTVDITEHPYSTARFAPELFEVDEQGRTFEPAERGRDAPFDAELVIEANPDLFAGQTVEERFEISVGFIDIDLPREITVSPRQRVEITALVHDAYDPELDWSSTAGGWVGSPQMVASDGVPGTVTWTHEHESASDPGSYPYSITLEALSSGGLLADGSPRRIKQMTVRLAELVIVPDDAVIEVGETIGYEAYDQNGDTIDATWTATGGTITSSGGAYTAGDEPGVYEVTATATDGSGRTATVPVEIFEPECPYGTWAIRSQHFLDRIDALSDSGGVDFEWLGGEYLMTFGGGSDLSGARLGWTIGATVPEGRIVMTIDGADSGSYSVEDDQLTILYAETSNTVDAVIEVAGQTISVPGQDASSVLMRGGTGTFECSGGVLTISHEITVLLDRVGD